MPVSHGPVAFVFYPESFILKQNKIVISKMEPFEDVVLSRMEL